MTAIYQYKQLPIMLLLTAISMLGKAQSHAIPDGLNENPSGALLYYENMGQIVDMNDNSRDEIKYYTTNSFPQTYLADEYVAFVFEQVDADTATEDTVWRIDMAPVYDEYAFDIVPVAEDEGEGILNYFVPQCPDECTGVKGFQRVIYEDVYTDIDMHFYSNENGIKAYFVIKPGADPSQIRLSFEGQDDLEALATHLKLSAGPYELILPNALAYELDHQNAINLLTWNAGYTDHGNDEVGFDLGAYDDNQTLVLQIGKPVAASPSLLNPANLNWSTYYGGMVRSSQTDIAIDPLGRNYYCGVTHEQNFPTSSNASYKSVKGDQDIYIVKFDSIQRRVFATFYGGTESDMNPSIAVGSDDEVHVVYYSQSNDVPMANPQPSGAWVDSSHAGGRDLVIAKFSSDGSVLKYSTYFGVSGHQEPTDIEINSKGDYYILGHGDIGNYTSQKTGAYFNSTGHCFIQRWNSNHTIALSTPFKSPTNSALNALCFDDHDNVFITGYSVEGFETKDPGGSAWFQSSGTYSYSDILTVTKLDSADALIWSTYYGGSYGSEGLDIATNGSHIYITGITDANDFPIKRPDTWSYVDSNRGKSWADPDLKDAFIVEFDNDGQQIWSTYWGGGDYEKGSGIAVDTEGNIFVSGKTSSNFASLKFPLKYNPSVFYQNYTHISSGGMASYLASFNVERRLTWSTFMGGQKGDEGEKVRTFEDDFLYFGGKTSTGHTTFPLENLGTNAWYDASKPPNTPQRYATFMARFDIDGYGAFTSINEPDMELKGDLVLFPNPARNLTALQGQSPILRVDVFNMQGQIVQTDFPELNKVEISIENFDPGIYLVKATIEKGIITKQLVVE